jgi:hypothetical protein
MDALPVKRIQVTRSELLRAAEIAHKESHGALPPEVKAAVNDYLSKVPLVARGCESAENCKCPMAALFGDAWSAFTPWANAWDSVTYDRWIRGKLDGDGRPNDYTLIEVVDG